MYACCIYGSEDIRMLIYARSSTNVAMATSLYAVTFVIHHGRGHRSQGCAPREERVAGQGNAATHYNFTRQVLPGEAPALRFHVVLAGHVLEIPRRIGARFDLKSRQTKQASHLPAL